MKLQEEIKLIQEKSKKEYNQELTDKSLELINDIVKIIEDNLGENPNKIVKFFRKIMTHIQMLNQIIKLVTEFVKDIKNKQHDRLY